MLCGKFMPDRYQMELQKKKKDCNVSRFITPQFKITGDTCNLIGSNWYDLFTNRTNFLL